MVELAETEGVPVSDMPEMKVKYKDVYHLKNLYVMFHEYLTEEGFIDDQQFQDAYAGHITAEILYMEKFIQKAIHQGGKEMWVWWRTIKKPHTKYSGFFRFHLDFEFHVVYQQDIEVMHQGKKMKIQKGEIEFFLRPRVVADYDNKWKNHWLLKYFRNIYIDRMMYFEIQRKEKELWRETYKFQHVLKRFFNMRLFVPTPEPFWRPIYGYEAHA